MDICIFGDSIAWGADDFTDGGWASLWRKHVERGGVRRADIYNQSISGDNTDKLLRRFAVEAAARSPEVVVFAVGINDAQYHKESGATRVAQERFVDNMHELVQQARKYAAHVFIIGLTQVNDALLQPILWDEEGVKCYGCAMARRYDDVLQQLAVQEDVTFISVWDVLSVDDLSDGLHPTTAGHAKLFATIVPRIEAVLQK